MRWKLSKLHNQIQCVYFNFDVLSGSKFNFFEHVIWGYIIGHFWPIPLIKWFFQTSKMHNSIISNPNYMKFVTIFKVFEIATTLMKTLFSFESHIKRQARWNIEIYGLTLRKIFNMLKFPNFDLKIHHDPISKWKSVQH